MDSKNHRLRAQAPPSLRPSVSGSDYVLSSGEPSLRQLTNPALTGVLKDHNDVNFKLIKTGMFYFFSAIFK